MSGTTSTTTRATTVTVRFFAAARQRMRHPTTSWSVQDGESITATLARYGLAQDPLFRRCCFLLNGVSAGHDDPVRAGDVLDVLPPFAGG